jgi:hypothetical protein
MLTTRWKIFRVLNYLHIFCLIGIVVVLWNNTFVHRLLDWLTFIWFAFVIGNSSLNIHLMNRYYPGHLPENWMRNLSTILFIPTLALIVVYGILVVFILVDPEERTRERTTRQLIALTGVLIVIGTGIYILWNQVVLRKELKRNYKAAMEHFLEEEPTAI